MGANTEATIWLVCDFEQITAVLGAWPVKWEWGRVGGAATED